MEIRPLTSDCHLRYLNLIRQLSDTINENVTLDIFTTRLKSVQQQDGYIYVITEGENGKQLVASGTLLIEQKFIHNGGKVGHIEDVSVLKEYQGQGIGSKLIKRCLTLAKFHRCYKTILDCSDQNIDFYVKNGFNVKGVLMRFDH